MSGIYTYEDYNFKPEGYSIYKWYRTDSPIGDLTLIGDTTISYTLDSIADIGKYIVFEVSPVTYDGIIGEPVRAFSQSKVVGEGINDPSGPIAKIYPNPVRDLLCIEPLKEISSVGLVNMTGRNVLSVKDCSSPIIPVSVDNLPQGVYFPPDLWEGCCFGYL